MNGVRWSNVPLPEGHLTALATGLVLQARLPLRLRVPLVIRAVVGPLIASLGVVTTAWAVVAAEDVDVASPAKVVTSGPYAFTRNPMYVGWTLVYAGVTLTVRSGWLLILLPPLLAHTHRTVLREERRLETRFGPDYRRYRERVRRYL